jgi:hypothetical protein
MRERVSSAVRAARRDACLFGEGRGVRIWLQRQSEPLGEHAGLAADEGAAVVDRL